MKLTRIHILIGSVVGLGVIGFVLWLIIQHFTSPPDTPIVLGGGSIYGETWFTDTDGWTSVSNNIDSASLHASASSTLNPNGIDNLTFTLFDTSPPSNPVTGTGGWAVVIRNKLPNGNVDPSPNPAVQLCSDPGCSAFNQTCGSFQKYGNVYFKVRSGDQLNAPPGTGPGGDTMKVAFHAHSCDSGVKTTCDTIYDVRLFTCRAGATPYFTTTCETNPSFCDVQVGNH